VIEPGAQAAVKATRNKRVGIIGTRATIASHAYERAIQELDGDIEVFAEACPLFVPLIEEGWLEDAVTDSIIARYLEKLLRHGVDTLVLGCTHYPLIRHSIQRFTDPDITLVDSAQNTALAVRKVLSQNKLAAPKKSVGKLQVSLTDQSTGFLRVAEEALGLQVGDVKLRPVQAAA
jgi:glutamate racemase